MSKGSPTMPKPSQPSSPSRTGKDQSPTRLRKLLDKRKTAAVSGGPRTALSKLSEKQYAEALSIGRARAEIGAALDLKARAEEYLNPAEAEAWVMKIVRASKEPPESSKEAVRTPILDWEQPGLDNLIKTGEKLLAQKKPARKPTST